MLAIVIVLSDFCPKSEYYISEIFLFCLKWDIFKYL